MEVDAPILLADYLICLPTSGMTRQQCGLQRCFDGVQIWPKASVECGRGCAPCTCTKADVVHLPSDVACCASKHCCLTHVLPLLLPVCVPSLGAVGGGCTAGGVAF